MRRVIVMAYGRPGFLFCAVMRPPFDPLPVKASQPAGSELRGVVATPFLKRRQQVLKPRDSPEIIDTLKPSVREAEAASTRPAKRSGRILNEVMIGCSLCNAL
jgi:hypothetical protein